VIHVEDYQNTLKALSTGSVRKVPHIGCSQSACLRIENKVEGFHLYCFKCTETAFQSHRNSPKERLKRQQEYEAFKRYKASTSYELPADFSRNISSDGLLWLGKAGWTLEMQRRYNIGYSKELNRVILPVYEDAVYCGYTARDTTGSNPKYLEKVPGGTLWGSSSVNVTDKPLRAVITEDILSAGRCGNFMKSYALLGTTLDTLQIARLIKHQSLLLFLDNDQAGISGALKIKRRLGLLTDVRLVHADVDPKNLTDKELKEVLCV